VIKVIKPFLEFLKSLMHTMFPSFVHCGKLGGMWECNPTIKVGYDVKVVVPILMVRFD
jgi:hypothetical protein